MENKGTIEFDKEKYLSLKRLYEKSVEEGRTQLVFESRLLLTSYVKYLLQHLSPRFETVDK